MTGSTGSGEHRPTDLHSHLVPAVDDGARDLEESGAGVATLVDAGVRRIVTTPHLDVSLTHDPDRLRARIGAVEAAWERACQVHRERFPDVEFGLGFEVMLDVPDPEPDDPALFLAGTRVLLVEWPGLQVPPASRGVLERLLGADVQPLVAHPERFRTRGPRWETAARWREMGVWLQVNMGSVTGRYGPEAREAAVRLLARGLVDCLSSDLHPRPGQRCRLEETRGWFEARGAHRAWELLTATNPSRILAGEAPLPVPPVVRGGGVMGRLKGLFGGEG